MTDLIGFFESHHVSWSLALLGGIVSFSLIILLARHFVWAKMVEMHTLLTTQAMTLHNITIKTNADYAEFHEHVVHTAEDVSRKYWKECQEMRCPKIDELTQRLNEHSRMMKAFVDDGRLAREKTQDTIENIEKSLTRNEHTVNMFTNEVGREILRWLRQGGDKP